MSKESTPSSAEDANLVLLKKRHEKFLARLMDILPCDRFASLETTRMTLLFFTVSGLDVLGSLESAITEQRKEEIINWIYSLQVSDGFVGSPFIPNENVLCSHIAMTYTALATLTILGDDLSRVDREGIHRGLRKLQTPDGSFMASLEDDNRDMRFVYCAAAICRFLGDDFAGVDKESMLDYIMKSLTYEGAFAQGPDLEAHGGSTYCALASLAILDKLEALDEAVREKCLRWCVLRLEEGFTGRPNKLDDTCYTFWLGASLHLLCGDDITSTMIDHAKNFVFTTQDGVIGGMAKWPDTSPDPLHTYLGLAGLALSADTSSNDGLRPVDPALNITVRAKNHLKKLHKS